MYYPDLSPYQYLQSERSHNRSTQLLNIGWLDHAHGYPQGSVLPAFVERLRIFCALPVVSTMGLHICGLCNGPEDRLDYKNLLPQPRISRSQDSPSFSLGSGEIRVIGAKGIIYAAPNMLYHYVVDHHYRPPDAFISAVRSSRLPDSQFTVCSWKNSVFRRESSINAVRLSAA
jgi:hypothetical protein